MGNTIPHYWTVDEIAARLKVNRTTVTRWCQSGELPAYSAGRFWLIADAEAEALIEKHDARWVTWDGSA